MVFHVVSQWYQEFKQLNFRDSAQLVLFQKMQAQILVKRYWCAQKCSIDLPSASQPLFVDFKYHIPEVHPRNDSSTLILLCHILNKHNEVYRQIPVIFWGVKISTKKHKFQLTIQHCPSKFYLTMIQYCYCQLPAARNSATLWWTLSARVLPNSFCFISRVS